MAIGTAHEKTRDEDDDEAVFSHPRRMPTDPVHATGRAPKRPAREEETLDQNY